MPCTVAFTVSEMAPTAGTMPARRSSTAQTSWPASALTAAAATLPTSPVAPSTTPWTVSIRLLRMP